MFTDPILNKLTKIYPKPTFTNRTEYLFEDLIESVISQQLSVKASDTIYKRFKLLFKPPVSPDRRSYSTPDVEQADTSGLYLFPTPQQIVGMPDDMIRTAGISFQKISYIKSIADAFLTDLIDTQKITTMTDDEVIATLTQIRGIGKWTAEMILIFTLKRPDIFSIGDLGLRNAIKKLYGITDQKETLTLSQTWSPYRSTACWYLWRSLENNP